MKKTALALAILSIGSLLYASDVVFPKIQGWKLHIDKMVYVPDNLWELIDGAAELYIAYDFQDLHIATYSGSINEEVTVEIYHHSTPENAYGIYTAERMPDYSFIEMGVQGYTGMGILHFFKGNFYVKIMSVGNVGVGEESMKTIAGSISASLNQSASWPEEINLFPDQGKIVMSDAYIASNFMGYSFFRSAFTARYAADGEFTLFVIHGKAGEAEAMLNKYKGMMKEDKIEQKGNIYLIQDLFNGKVFLSKNGDYLVGVYNAGNEDLAMEYIRKTLEKIGDE